MGITVGHSSNLAAEGAGIPYQAALAQGRRQRFDQLAQTIQGIGRNIRGARERQKDRDLRTEELDFRRESRDLARMDRGFGLMGQDPEEALSALPGLTRTQLNAMNPRERMQWEQLEDAAIKTISGNFRDEQKIANLEKIRRDMEGILKSPGAMRGEFPEGQEPGQIFKGPDGGFYTTDPKTKMPTKVSSYRDNETAEMKAQWEMKKQRAEKYPDLFREVYTDLEDRYKDRPEAQPYLTYMTAQHIKDMYAAMDGQLPIDGYGGMDARLDAMIKRGNAEARKSLDDMERERLKRNEFGGAVARQPILSGRAKPTLPGAVPAAQTAPVPARTPQVDAAGYGNAALGSLVRLAGVRGQSEKAQVAGLIKLRQTATDPQANLRERLEAQKKLDARINTLKQNAKAKAGEKRDETPKTKPDDSTMLQELMDTGFGPSF